jgi:14-3-3 protein epsilon
VNQKMSDCRSKLVYLAGLAEQAERYDEMAEYMEAVSKMPEDLSLQERNLLSVAYKNLVGKLRAAWRVASSIEQKQKASGPEEAARMAHEYCANIEAEIRELCNKVIELVDGNLLPTAPAGEAQLFYSKSKCDYYRYIAEISTGTAKAEAEQNSRQAFRDASGACSYLPVTHPIRLGMALSQATFQYEVLGDHSEAIKALQVAFHDAIEDLDNVGEDHYKDATLIMQLMKDNLATWTEDVES